MDIVEQLRKTDRSEWSGELLDMAADEIERLRWRAEKATELICGGADVMAIRALEGELDEERGVG